ncbi:serine/threonine protein kinase [Pararhodobacter sp. SW119]|uniref:serine/threonine protein kinase n=1 Tax=Pararhodobacter sp. SW119 TaxID=2780075 RepID=UPI001ADEDD77|nr:serine/threonine protein kinase [Pararhodobacter sp. SW119]
MIDSRPSDIFKPDQLINNTYRIEGVLGRGGTSEVYRARSEISGRLLAMKVLKSEFAGNEDYLVLMNREEAMRDIRHDAVVRYSENHRTPDGHVYLIMDYVDGPGLHELLKKGGLPAEDLLVICARVASGLAVAHGRNIFHRDLSPDNIILKGGKPEQAVIIDFGIAKDDNPGAETITGGEFAGKYAYAAPEQLSGRADARSDIYALGALLLATFRGAPPDVGRNPMEVMRRKAMPLDTEGVPEPLKSLIDRMTQPDPDHRFQSAQEVLEAIDPAYLPDEAALQPTTLPPRRAGGATGSAAAKPSASAATAPPADTRKSGGRGLLLAGIAVLALAGAGVGGYFADWLDPMLGPPRADPYTLVVAFPAEGAPQAEGHVPDAALRDSLAARLAAQGGEARLALARGDIPDAWGEGIAHLVETLDPLEEWRIAATGTEVEVSGMTRDRSLQERVNFALAAPVPGDLSVRADILLGPVRLPVEEVDGILEAGADCGPLAQIDAPETAYSLGERIAVAGRIETAATRDTLYDALTAVAGDRPVVLDLELLNRGLCLVEETLAGLPSGGFELRMGFGDRPDTNPSGRYYVGENPVIDVVLPAGVTDGYLWVSIVDVKGAVYHLLPNNNRQENAVAALRAGRDGTVPVRVAYAVEEAQGNGRLAFLVDGNTLGKSRVLVLHAAQPVFDDLRPTSESADSFTEALSEAIAARGGTGGITADSRILVTAEAN